MRDRTDVAPQSQSSSLSLPFGAAPAVPASNAKQGPGSLLAIPSGSLAGDLRGIAVDQKRLVATYELLVANETMSPVATFTYVVGANAGGMMSWNTITVPAFTSIAVAIDIPLPPGGKGQRVVVELHAQDAHLTLDAKTPPPRARAQRISLLLGAALAALIGSIAYNAQTPKVVALAAPSSVIAGKPFTVAYALGGNVTGNYLIETPDGFQVRRGTLERSQTAVTIELPQFPIPRGYDMLVTAQGKLGADTRVIHLTAIPATPPPQAALPFTPQPAPLQHSDELPSIALASDHVPSGGQINVSYPMGSGASGNITLYDQNNTPRGTALLDKTGHASILAPSVTSDQSMRVILRLQSGNSSIESTAAVTVQANTQPTTPPETAGPGELAEEVGSPFALAGQSFKSGAPIHIRILRHEDALRIGLSTAQGNVVSQEDVALSQSDIALQAPTVDAPAPYLIVATYRRGVGQETIVRRINIAP